jgi:hypothetical protein
LAVPAGLFYPGDKARNQVSGSCRGEISVELEQRVKTLEYEMKIMKNEVQRTLLDIQEQILVHYYPSLRAEETAPSEGVMQALESIRSKRQEVSQETPDLLPTKKVSLEDIRAGRGENDTLLAETSSSQPGAGATQAAIIQLSGWVSGTAQKIGRERTAKLIQAYTGKGIISPELESPLLRLTGLISEDNAPAQVAVNEVLKALLQLNELLGHDSNAEEALSLIEEANLG